MQLDFFLNKLNEALDLLCEDNPSLSTPDKAFGPWSLMLLENVPIDKALESYVEGGGDKGLDVIYVPDEPGTLIIIQAKHPRNINRNLSRNDIVNTLNGVQWLLNGDINDPTVNPSFRARANEFREALISYFPKVEINFVTTGRGPADDGFAEIQKFLQEANSMSEQVFSVISIDINEISQLKTNIMMGRLEIYARNPERVIHVEHQINNFDEFVLQLDKTLKEEPVLNTINLKNLYPHIFWKSLNEEVKKR